MVFTKEEKTKIDLTLVEVTKDLRYLFQISGMDEIRKRFKVVEDGKERNYDLVIREKDMYMILQPRKGTDWWMDLDKKKKSGRYKPCKIIDYTLAFEFLKIYETIRGSVANEVYYVQKEKNTGMQKIEEVLTRLSKEATIEVEIPDTTNQSEIEILQENGKNIGKIKVGPISLTILTSPSIRIVSKKENNKIKRK